MASFGRRLVDTHVAPAHALPGNEFSRRRAVLFETLSAFERAEPHDAHHRLAAANLARWRACSPITPPVPTVEVIAADWGEVTAWLTARHGRCFAVLNMAHPVLPGGAYVEGAAAQEENMFRRTDCHFSIDRRMMLDGPERYRPGMRRLLEAVDGAVYLDVERPRVCIRGPEDPAASDLGYRWLADDEIFPFYELRAAALDMSGGGSFRERETRRRVAAQLDTLIEAGVRHAVLGAFGCGAFRNPADRVARAYRSELEARRGEFDVVAFAVLPSAHGPDNATPFARVFSDDRA